jgi:hypothetical protein
LLPVSERVVGQEHPATFQARSDLAYWTGRAGDTTTAQNQLTALVPVAEHALGDQHPVTVAIRQNLAHWTERPESSDPEAR